MAEMLYAFTDMCIVSRWLTDGLFMGMAAAV